MQGSPTIQKRSPDDPQARCSFTCVRRRVRLCARALRITDGVFIAQVAKLEQIPEKERLNPEAVVDAIAEAGRPAFYEENADAIVDRIVPLLKERDIVAVFSNGGFDNIHEKLLAQLRT